MEKIKIHAILVLTFLAAWAGGSSHAAAAPLTPGYLRCEYLVNPSGIDETAPRLSWRVASKLRDEKQVAYQVLVADTEAALAHGSGDLWDSEQVAGDDTTAIVYRGRALVSGQVCHWKVRVWDKDGKASDWSEPAVWSMGLLNQKEWRGEWIGYDKMRQSATITAPFVGAKWIWFKGDTFPDFPKGKREFMSELKIPDNAKVARAELLVAADTSIWFNLNGQAVPMSHSNSKGNARLVDVTPLMNSGVNTVRVEVENAQTGPAGLIAQLTATTTDGQSYTLVTDGSWRATDKGGDNWHIRPIGATEWPPCQVIGPPGCAPWGELKYTPLQPPPPPYLRTEFNVSKKVQRATLYATALGLVDLHLNGQLVSQDRFTPGWTDYAKRVHYRAYDVTPLVRRGRNALGAILADGWYSGSIGWGHIRDHYGKKPRLRAQLQFDYSDGSHDLIASGPDWKASTGAIQSGDFLIGEFYDARRAQPWSEPGFDDSQWDAVATGAEMEPVIQAHPGPPVRAFAELEPKSITQTQPGVYVFDMGQNFAGVARLKIKGRPGQKITLRFAERLKPDGSIYTVNLRGAICTDTYVCRGRGTETWEPRFTYHGFQYVEVLGLRKPPSRETITGVALSSATTDAGQFACSDPMLNRLAKNTYWTQRANFIDIPTDCPQRDERLGWMGDAQVYIRAASLHEDVQAFFTKWLVDVEDGQRKDGEYPMVAPVKVAGDDGGPAWADAGVICPWTVYDVYGDTRILEKHYKSMARFIDFCKKRSTSDMLPPKEFHCFGDWLNINDDTPKTVICTAYFAYSTKLMARIAAALGKSDDAATYNELFEKIKASFNRAYVKPDGRIEGDTQTGYVLALSFDLLDPDRQKQALQYLVENIKKRDWHLSTGFVGTKSLMLTLAGMGRNDVAWRLIHNDTFPSWGFCIRNGATSIWERWDGWTPEKGFQDPAMNSFAHYSFGAVYQWMVENIGGIQSDVPAYKHIVIAPQPDDKVTFADTTYDSIQGPIETHWRRAGQHLSLKVTIPANTTATVSIPAAELSSVFEGGRPAIKAQGVNFLRMDSGAAVFEVASGTYHFETK
jgi:alpha-L-rhamnosidase